MDLCNELIAGLPAGYQGLANQPHPHLASATVARGTPCHRPAGQAVGSACTVFGFFCFFRFQNSFRFTERRRGSRSAQGGHTLSPGSVGNQRGTCAVISEAGSMPDHEVKSTLQSGFLGLHLMCSVRSAIPSRRPRDTSFTSPWAHSCNSVSDFACF